MPMPASKPTVLFFILCACIPGACAQAGAGAISGSVVEASSGDPVRKAVVTVTWHGTPRSWATMRTDGSGRFHFDGLPPGVYDLRAAKPGMGVAIYGANSTRETGETITLADGETRDGLKLRFIRSASISGNVTGPDGDPAIQAQVMLLHMSRNNGKPALQVSQQSQTNDRGEYQISGVAPGQYYVFADARGGPPDSQKVVSGQFYGGTHESKDSTVLSVRDGDRLRGIDFQMISEPAVRIAGHVVGVPQQASQSEDQTRGAGAGTLSNFRRGRTRGGFVQVSIQQAASNPMGFGQGVGTQPPDYRFESGTIPPGEYRVVASVQIDGKSYFAWQLVDARSGTAEVTLTLAPAVEVKGQVRIEGPAPGQPPSPLRIALVPNGAAAAFGAMDTTTAVGSDGKFTIAQVPPGEYNLNINPMPLGQFLKSARLGDDEVRFKPLEIKAGPEAELNIVISTRGAKIEGQVDAAGGDPARAAILVAPVGELHEFARFYYSVLADDHGKFKLLGLAPGKYKIFALEKLTPVPLRSPEVADQLIALDGDYAQEIELIEDGTVEAHPKLIPLERGRTILP
jgi:hypothetical protein